MKFKRSYGRKKRSKAPAIIIALLLVVGVAFALAMLWQDIEKGKVEESEVSASVEDIIAGSSEESSVSEAVSVVESSQESSEEISSESSEVESSEEVAPVAGREAFYYALPENPAVVGDDYFQDAVFFGDSISTGIPLYLQQPLAGVPVYAKQGISPYNAATGEHFPVNGINRTMLQAALEEHGERGKIYILIGGNALGYEKESFISGYRTFLEAVTAQYPNSKIYVQSITPVTDHVTQTYPNLGTGDINAKINEYNLAIMELSKEMNLYYLDIAAALVDENGQLPREASPSDGMHFGADYYFKWYDYLKSHTAK